MQVHLLSIKKKIKNKKKEEEEQEQEQDKYFFTLQSDDEKI